jgi:hypothetical protein
MHLLLLLVPQCGWFIFLFILHTPADIANHRVLEANEAAWVEHHERKVQTDVKGKYNAKRNMFQSKYQQVADVDEENTAVSEDLRLEEEKSFYGS